MKSIFEYLRIKTLTDSGTVSLRRKRKRFSLPFLPVFLFLLRETVPESVDVNFTIQRAAHEPITCLIRSEVIGK